MNNEIDQAEGKRKYEPPQLTTISLRPEEAVLGHCKTLSGGNPFSLGGCVPIGACNSVGS
jgi:hypothetical protein